MKTFETTGPMSLVVRNAAGTIEIHSTDGAQTEVEVEPLRGDEASRRAAADTQVEMRGTGADAVVSVEVPKPSSLSFKNAEVQVIARVPHGSNVDATAASADVEGRGRFGSVRVKTASGDVDFDEAGGDATVKTASGDVSFTGIQGVAGVQTASGDVQVGRLGGTSKVQTASGDVHVGEALSSLRVQTASGDESVDAVSEGDVNLQSASGDLRIGVKHGSSLWIDAKSISGSTTSELEMVDGPPDGETPRLEIRATTLSGDVHLFRSDSVPA
jgi:DUF4097 and DUF4098 domain-containing protein YvlB